MSPLKISIVTPSLNQAPFLEQTIQSVLSQDYPHLEYIVIDGGSSDGSVEIIRRHAEQIAFWCSENDEGQSDAIAKGFERATGDIIGWLNSDDILLPGAISAVAQFFENHSRTETVSGGAYCINEDGRPLKRQFGTYTLGVRASYGRLRFYEQDGVFQQATFWRRSAYEAVGGLDRSLQFAMDRDLFLRLAKRKRFARLPQLLACFRLHKDCKSLRIQHVRRKENELLNRRHAVDAYNPLLRKAIYYRYRLPSLLRKAWLGLLRSSGGIRLKGVNG